MLRLKKKRQQDIFLPCINKACFIETGHISLLNFFFHIPSAQHNMAEAETSQMEKWNMEQISYENNYHSLLSSNTTPTHQ